MKRSRLAAPLLAICTLAAATSAGADTLVLKNGSTVETKGPWKVKGALVVFSRTNGALSSLRVSEVDLERSKTETAKATAPAAPAPPPAPARPVVLRLTDNDVGHVGEEAEAATGATGASGATGDKTSEAPPTRTVVVVGGWEKQPGANGGLTITGTLSNPSKFSAQDITVDIGLYGPDGKLVQISAASVASTTLNPGQRTTFRCDFPTVESMTAAKFDVRSRNVATEAPAAPPAPPSNAAN